MTKATQFEVTGPGEYKTRSMGKAIVESVANVGDWPFGGRIEGLNGPLSWTTHGHFAMKPYDSHPYDIVGIWVDADDVEEEEDYAESYISELIAYDVDTPQSRLNAAINLLTLCDNIEQAKDCLFASQLLSV